MHEGIRNADFLWITLDTLRYDVAVQEWEAGRTPFLHELIPAGWERRHTPGSFTFAPHAAFFAGFLPTPVTPGPHIRSFALAFSGSETIGPDTVVFDAPDIPAGFRKAGYHTACIGGTGFFSRQTPLGGVLPGLFGEAGGWVPGARGRPKNGTRKVHRGCSGRGGSLCPPCLHPVQNPQSQPLQTCAQCHPRRLQQRDAARPELPALQYGKVKVHAVDPCREVVELVREQVRTGGLERNKRGLRGSQHGERQLPLQRVLEIDRREVGNLLGFCQQRDQPCVTVEQVRRGIALHREHPVQAERHVGLWMLRQVRVAKRAGR